MSLNLYFSSKANPRGASVISQINPTPQSVRDMTLGDVRAVNLYVVDGEGDYDDVSGAAGASVMVALGEVGETALWANTNWTRITDGWSGQIAVPSADFSSLFDGGSNPVQIEMAIRIENASGEPVVMAAPLVKLWKSAIDDDSQEGNPFENSGDGEYAIPNGADIGSVTGLALGIVPRRVFVAVRKPAGGLNLSASVVAGSITTGGFNFTLSGQVDSGNYKLDYVLLY